MDIDMKVLSLQQNQNRGSQDNKSLTENVLNFEKYPWLQDLNSPEALREIEAAKYQYQTSGAVVFHELMTPEALKQCVQDAQREEDNAYTTDDTHTPYLLPVDTTDKNLIHSVRNFEMRTRVASIAYDELQKSDNSPLVYLYQHPTLLRLISEITSIGFKSADSGARKLYLSEDPIGACSINVFRTNYHHSFHFDESEFSTTLMIQEAEIGGKFQYTPPLRQSRDDFALPQVAAVIQKYHKDFSSPSEEEKKDTHRIRNFLEQTSSSTPSTEPCPPLNTLDFRPGTLSIFSGSRSLHQVTQVKGTKSRLVAVLTYASQPGFKNSKEVQEMFWGRSSYS